MLMSIRFPALVSEAVALDSLAFSSINEVMMQRGDLCEVSQIPVDGPFRVVRLLPRSR